jgi:cytochrome c6
MGKTSRFGIVLTAAVLFGGHMSLTQSGGEAVYKAKCQSCHGAQGVPNPGIAKNMGVKAATDPAVKAQTAAQMITITTDGKGKMPAFKGKLTDVQIKDSVDYFRTFAK